MISPSCCLSDSNPNAYLQAPPSPLERPFSSLRLYTTPTASQLADVLATLERRTYLCIFASEYVAYARDCPTYCPNLQQAINLNGKIINWVKFSIVKLDDLIERSTKMEFFLETAQVKFHLLEFWCP